MRLLVPDRLCLYSGIETLNCAVLPYLAAQSSGLVWALPEYRLPDMQKRCGPANNLYFESSEWPRTSIKRGVEALARRLSVPFPSFENLRMWLYENRLRHLIQHYKVDHALCTWILDSMPEELGIPISAVFLDRNWKLFGSNFSGETADRLDKRLYEWLAGSQIVFSISRVAREELLEFAPEFADKYQLVPLAADCPVEREYVLQQKTRRPDEETIFYFPGTVAAHKNHLNLLKAVFLAAQAGASFRVVLSGYGTDMLFSQQPASSEALQQVQAYCREHQEVLAKHVVAMGYCSREDVEKQYLQSDYAILPSVYEGYGLPLVEAVSWGLPILCARNSAYSEQIEFYDCQDWVTLFDPHSPEEIAECLVHKTTLPYPNLTNRIALLKRVRRWTWGDVARSYFEAMHNIY